MHSDLNYLLARQREAEFVEAAERARLANEVREPAPRRGGHGVIGRAFGALRIHVISHRLGAATRSTGPGA